MEIILTAKDLEEVQYINSQLNPTDYPPGLGSPILVSQVSLITDGAR